MKIRGNGRSDWKGLLVTGLMPMLLLSLGIGFAQENRSRFWMRYYPLAVGNAWQYSVTSESKGTKEESVTWKVVNETNNAAGPVFAVWPTPVEADDEGMQLQATPDGLLELTSNFYILRFPVKKGDSWKVNGQHDRILSVISEGKSCAVGELTFSRCAVVRDDDREAKLRTITTYAFGVGPVRYEYHKLVLEDFEAHASQILHIVSYSVKPSVPKK